LPINSTMVQELADQQHLGDLGRHHLQAAAHPPTSVQPSNNGQVPGSIPFSVGWNLLLHRCFHNARPPGLWSQSYWTGYLYCQYSGKSPHSIFIKAAMRSASFVLMAEAAAMALAARCWIYYSCSKVQS
jgi:hypothetical protein